MSISFFFFLDDRKKNNMLTTMATQDTDSNGFQEATLFSHTETAKDLDTTRVENISDRSWYDKAPQPVVSVVGSATPILEECCMRGAAKNRHHRHSMHHALPSGAEMGEYGQDHTYTRDVSGVLANGTPFSVRVAAVADGHGSHGNMVSRDVIVDLDQRLTVEWLGGLLTLVLGHRDDEARGATEALYEALDDETSAYSTDGTTLSVLLVFSCENRVFFVASNVGDSPILLIHQPSGKILCAHAEHTWDSIAERRVQLEASRNAGRDDAVVATMVFLCPILMAPTTSFRCSSPARIPSMKRCVATSSACRKNKAWRVERRPSAR
jgi:hypothetical protein